jgi:hypothetical protein
MAVITRRIASERPNNGPILGALSSRYASSASRETGFLNNIGDFLPLAVGLNQ